MIELTTDGLNFAFLDRVDKIKVPGKKQGIMKVGGKSDQSIQLNQSG